MTAVHVKAIDEGNGAMALGYLERGEVQAISWNSTPEHVARNGIRSRDPITGPGQSTVTRSTAGVDPLSDAISSFFGR